MTVKVRGRARILKNLRREIGRIEGDTFRGLLVAAKFIEGKAKQITPVDEGILVNSSFSQAERRASGAVARVGYTAQYAPFVHEMPASTNFSKAGAENKFLEKAVTRNSSRIISIIRRFAKV